MESDYLKNRRLQKLGTKQPTPKKMNVIAKVSDKRKIVNREYKKIVKGKLKENPLCEIKSPECTGKAQGLNHKQKRSPKNLTKLSNLENACNACNGYVERHPKWAKENGHSKSRFSK